VLVDVQKLVELTTQTTPEAATHWSTRKMADVLGVHCTTVLRHWQRLGLKPHLAETFKVWRDPKFVEKLQDIAGLYMSPPEHALVLCCDEKNQVQATECSTTLHRFFHQLLSRQGRLSQKKQDGQALGHCIGLA
jgi:hypothetical protein